MTLTKAECCHAGGYVEDDDGGRIPVAGIGYDGDGGYECRWCGAKAKAPDAPHGGGFSPLLGVTVKFYDWFCKEAK